MKLGGSSSGLIFTVARHWISDILIVHILHNQFSVEKLGNEQDIYIKQNVLIPFSTIKQTVTTMSTNERKTN